jgi:hypothetical protein
MRRCRRSRGSLECLIGTRKQEAHRLSAARHRARQRAGVMTAMIEVDAIGLDWLISKARCLDPRTDIDGAGNRQARAAVGAAITDMIRVSSRT